MHIKLMVLLLLTANLQVEIDPATGKPVIDPVTGRVRIKTGTCRPRIEGPVPRLPSSRDVVVPAGAGEKWLEREAVEKARKKIHDANGMVWQQPPVLTIKTASGVVNLEYFDAWAKATGWGKSGPRLEAWGQVQALRRGVSPAEFEAALAAWKQGRQAAARQEIQRIEERFLDEHGVTLQEASKAAGYKK